jgi:hypothetical protein
MVLGNVYKSVSAAFFEMDASKLSGLVVWCPLSQIKIMLCLSTSENNGIIMIV